MIRNLFLKILPMTTALLCSPACKESNSSNETQLSQNDIDQPDSSPESGLQGVAANSPEAQVAQPTPEPVLHMTSHHIRSRSNLYSELRKLNIAPKTILDLIDQCKELADLSNLPANQAFDLFWADEQQLDFRQIRFHMNPTIELSASLKDDLWHVEKIEHPVTTELRTFTGIVTNSLWESAINSGVEPQLVVNLTEIFAWQVDFNREVRPGDRWRLVVEEQFVKESSIGWGAIMAAEYINQDDTYTGIRFVKQDGHAEYFAPDGQSLRRMFLKSPIKFGRISSRFTNARFHPILKENRPHLGVDYAAPRGTPIRAVGDGTIVRIGWNGGSGKMIKIRHNSIYQTAYLHLNGYAKGLKRHSKVKQGQIIGYVGSTGLATGPHLHFSFYENGRYVDPLGRKFPSADPVPESEQSAFRAMVENVMPLLPEWKFAQEGEHSGMPL